VGTAGPVSLKAVLAMLVECAEGHAIKRKLHHYWVSFHGHTYRGLPLGEHGAKRPEIELGHIRHMVRLLGIEPACASRHFQELGQQVTANPVKADETS
jgi:hypothetical protein